MARKGKKLNQLTIEKVAAEGKCVTKNEEGQVVFVQGVVPGDVVDVVITKKRKSYLEGRPIYFHNFSNQRIEPFCRHFGICGGCKWQHLPYDLQLQYKQQQVEDQLERIGKIKLPEINPIIGSEKSQYYRNKLEYTLSDTRWLTDEEAKSEIDIDRRGIGFHVPGRFDRVVDIEHCHLQEEPTNVIRNALRSFAFEKGLSFYNIREHKGLLRNLIIRKTVSGMLMVIVQFGENDPEKIEMVMSFLKQQFSEIDSLQFIINLKKNETFLDQDVIVYDGLPHISETLGKLKFKIGPKSFFQTNSYQAERLYDKAIELAGLQGDEVVYDLYSGTGTIANYLAQKAKKVIGIESVPEAIEDAKENARVNDIENAIFYAGDAKDLFTEKMFNQEGFPEIVVTDPPRAGMSPEVVEMLLSVKPETIVYVSCNPATQARDLSLLSEKYNVSAVQPVDMFPHTHHVENIVALKRKEI
jgi:23S rRNA (uracil1939-C5)-methyltransferase